MAQQPFLFRYIQHVNSPEGLIKTLIKGNLINPNSTFNTDDNTYWTINEEVKDRLQKACPDFMQVKLATDEEVHESLHPHLKEIYNLFTANLPTAEDAFIYAQSLYMRASEQNLCEHYLAPTKDGAEIKCRILIYTHFTIQNKINLRYFLQEALEQKLTFIKLAKCANCGCIYQYKNSRSQYCSVKCQQNHYHKNMTTQKRQTYRRKYEDLSASA